MIKKAGSMEVGIPKNKQACIEPHGDTEEQLLITEPMETASKDTLSYKMESMSKDVISMTSKLFSDKDLHKDKAYHSNTVSNLRRSSTQVTHQTRFEDWLRQMPLEVFRQMSTQ